MMPETYTQEQISEAVRECDRFAEKHYDKEIAPYVEILSYALSIAEQERDALKARCAELEGGLVDAIKLKMLAYKSPIVASLLSEQGVRVLPESIAKIDALLAAPSESAVEMVERIRDTEYARYADTGNQYIKHILTDSDAAALIEGLQRRVPRKMLEEIWVEASRFDANGEYKSIDAIAAKHGVVIE